VCALLNDLFVCALLIQARGGCLCAGPYGLDLLGVGAAGAAAIEEHLLDHNEVLRPGFARVSLPYFATPSEVELVIESITHIATHGWRLLPEYSFNYKTGEWRHHSRLRSFPERKWLATFDPTATIADLPNPEATGGDVWRRQLEEGRARLAEGSSLQRGGRTRQLADQAPSEQDASLDGPAAEAELLRWFMLPTEAAFLLTSALVPSNNLPSTDAVNNTLAGAYNPKQYPEAGKVGESGLCLGLMDDAWLGTELAAGADLTDSGQSPSLDPAATDAAWFGRQPSNGVDPVSIENATTGVAPTDLENHPSIDHWTTDAAWFGRKPSNGTSTQAVPTPLGVDPVCCLTDDQATTSADLTDSERSPSLDPAATDAAWFGRQPSNGVPAPATSGTGQPASPPGLLGQSASDVDPVGPKVVAAAGLTLRKQSKKHPLRSAADKSSSPAWSAGNLSAALPSPQDNEV
jgi:hypothetical protein